MKTMSKKRQIRWSGCTPEEHDAIIGIVRRADDLATRMGQDPIQLAMDLTACHLNGCSLDLERLLAFPDFDFTHDVWGIHRHIDRTTGELGGCFSPRCSRRER